jgi:pimeloyl-ACP methyl ester carboxylesterase
VGRKLVISKVAPARKRAAIEAGDDYGATDGPDWRGVDWPAHLHRIEIGGVEANYVDIGPTGPSGSAPPAGDEHPIVFVHGLAGQWQNWLENIPRFARSRRIIVPDLPGFGRSDMAREDISIEYYGRWLERLLDRLDVGPVVVVGNSMGGFIAAELAITQPQRVERMLLISAAGISTAEILQPAAIVTGKLASLLGASTPAQMRLTAGRPGLRRAALMAVARHPGALAPDLVYEGFLKGTGKDGFYQALMACITYDFRDRLPQIGCPTLVVWGEKDMIIPVRDADAYVSMIPGARKVIFEDTGHVAMAERPAAFNAELDEFLDYQVSEGELEEEDQARRAAAMGGNGSAPA